MTEKGSRRPRNPLEAQNGAKSGREIQMSPSHRGRFASGDNWLAAEDVHIDATPTEVRHVQGISKETVQTIQAAERELFTDLSTAEDNLEDSNFQIGMSTGRPPLLHNGRGINRPIGLVQERQIHGGAFSLRTVEIAKIPGETLGFYIREGNGAERRDGIFVSRLMLGGAVEGSGLICVGDEIVFVNSVDVMRKTLDEVYLIMQIPTRLLLTFKRKQFGKFLYRPKSNEGIFYSPARYLGTLRTNKYKKSKMNGGASHSAGDIVHAVGVMETESESQDSDSMERVHSRRGRGSLDMQGTQGAYYPEAYERETSTSVASSSRASLDVPPPSANHARTLSLGLDDKRTEAHRYIRKDQSVLRRGPGSRSASTSDDPDSPTQLSKVLSRAASYGPESSPMDGDDDVVVFVDDEDYDDLTVSDSHLNDFNNVHGFRSSAPARHSNSRLLGNSGEKMVSRPPDPVGDKKPPPGLRHSSSSDDITAQTNGSSRQYLKSNKPHSNRRDKSPRPRSAILDSFFPSSSRKSVETSSNGSKKQRTSYLDMLKQQQRLSSLMRNVGGRKQNTSAKKLDRNKELDLSIGNPKYVPKPSPDKKTRLPSQSRPLDMDLTEFYKYKSDVGTRIRPRHIPCSGILTLHLYGGRKMAPSSATKRDMRDLYAVIEVDGVHKAQTATVSGKEELVWDEKFEIDLEKSHDLSVMIYSYNHWEPDVQRKPCNRGMVRFSQLLMQAKTKDEIFKLGLRMEPRGIIYMVLTFTERHTTLKRVPSLDRKGLFGVQLDVVVQRENSGRNVPIIVLKCVEEIEDRGLNYVGVYRVCGSAKRKKRLREEFDTASAVVDLSRENYPDINVITGMLKDYLRELPEPLFTSKLCGELLDTFSSRSLEDPVCNGELLQNMIESLPAPNKETGALMLDHLKAIANLSDVNKMNAYNLAVCFGPVLMSSTTGAAPSGGSSKDKRSSKSEKGRGDSGRGDSGRDSTDYEKHIKVLQSMIEIWPGRRELGESKSKASKVESLPSSRPNSPKDNRATKASENVAVDEVAPPVPLQSQEEDSCYHSNDDLDEMVAAGGAAAAEVEKKLQELNWDSDNLEVSAC